LNNVLDKEGNVDGKNTAALAMKESIMKALQIDQYKKRRIDTFDFAYIGETEDFSITL